MWASVAFQLLHQVVKKSEQVLNVIRGHFRDPVSRRGLPTALRISVMEPKHSKPQFLKDKGEKVNILEGRNPAHTTLHKKVYQLIYGTF